MRAADLVGLVGLVGAAGSSDLRGPVGYQGPWVLIALGALAVVAAYVVVVLLATRRPDPERVVRGAREIHLARLEQVEAAVGEGRIGVREGHLQVSELVRSYAGAVSDLPASTMTLADLRREAPSRLADIVELVYPPEFAPGEDLARERFREAVRRSRKLLVGDLPWT